MENTYQRITFKNKNDFLQETLYEMKYFHKLENFLTPQDVIERAYILLSSLLHLMDFKLPTVLPTMADSIQFEWRVDCQNKTKKVEKCLEVEIFSNKITIFLALVSDEHLKSLINATFKDFNCENKDIFDTIHYLKTLVVRGEFAFDYAERINEFLQPK